MTTFDTTFAREFKTNYTMVSLNNTSDYYTNFTLNGVYLFMTVNYNQRTGCRLITIESADSSVLLSQTLIRFGKRCELNFNSNQLGLDYYMTLKPIDETRKFDKNYDYLNWANDFQLCFVGWDYSFTIRGNDNLKVRLTGN